MSAAVGIHDHDSLKLGLKQADLNKAKRSIAVEDILSGGTEIQIPDQENRFAGTTFGLYKNDAYGTCGPTALCNYARLVSKGLTGTQVSPSDADMVDLYKRSGNPNFPKEDNGVELQDMLDQAHKGGLGELEVVAFARARDLTDSTLDALTAVFGGDIWGQTLTVAQQAQTDATPPRWDYVKGSAVWGGHATLHGRYFPEAGGVDDPQISWAMEVETTPAYRSHDLEEAWVPIFPWHFQNPSFLAGVDINALASAYKSLTGKELPIPLTPPNPDFPPPSDPPNATPADIALYEATLKWSQAKHVGSNRRAAEAVKAWAKAKGFE